MRLAPGNRLIDVQSSVNLPASGFELDLTDGNFVRRGPTSFPFYESRVIVGYAAGAWNGLGIDSSAAAASPIGDGLGIALASQIFNGGGGNIGAIALAANDLIIRYTLYGDANLDRTVDISDLGILATNWQQSPSRWNQGDFNYDGIVDISDLGMLATNWQQTVPTVPVSQSASRQVRAMQLGTAPLRSPFSAVPLVSGARSPLLDDVGLSSAVVT